MSTVPQRPVPASTTRREGRAPLVASLQSIVGHRYVLTGDEATRRYR